jgi:hypothetical protein
MQDLLLLKQVVNIVITVLYGFSYVVLYSLFQKAWIFYFKLREVRSFHTVGLFTVDCIS